MKAAVLATGRFGDAIGILRMVPLLNAKYGRISFVISHDYSSLLDGQDYCDVEPYNAPFEDVHGAVAFAQSKFQPVLNLCVYGNGFGVSKTQESFCQEPWAKMGLMDRYFDTPLIFDRRDSARETQLIAKVPTNKPWLLYNMSGNSSPFPFQGQLRLQLSKWRDRFQLIDIGLVKAHRIYDLLAFYDRAAVLVTTDTSTLHLAAASTVPTIALITDKPSMWHGAAPTCNCPVKIRYGEYPNRHQEIDDFLSSIQPTVRTVQKPAHVTVTGPRLIHIWSEYPATGDDAKRYAFTRKTWEAEWKLSNWRPTPLTDDMFSRSSRTELKDVRRLPFIKDMIALGVNDAEEEDIIVLTNNDTCFMKGIGKAILRDVRKSGCLWAHRWDFNDLQVEPKPHQLFDGQLYVGVDLFAFTVAWWKQHGQEYPDMLLGSEAWDWMMRELMKLNRGVEWNTGIFHQRHDPFWGHPRNKNSNPAQLHNKRLAREFLTKHKLPQDGFSR